MSRAPHPTPEQLSQYVAILLDDAAAAYQMFARTAPSIMSSAQPETANELFAVIRNIGSSVGVTLANANRLIDEVMSRYDSKVAADGGQLQSGIASYDDPRYLQKLLRALEDSFVLLIDINARQDLLGRPLLHPAKLAKAMDNSEVRKWLDFNKERTLLEGPLILNDPDA